MKKVLFALMAAAAMTFCSCEELENMVERNEDSLDTLPAGDIAPYLGTYTLDRSLNANLSILTFSVPVNRDLESRVVYVTKDIASENENAVIMTVEDGTIMKGRVTAEGLRLEDDVIDVAIDTTVSNIPINAVVKATMVHPLIAAPVDGHMEWTSNASGSASVQVPMMGNVNATLSGNVVYKADVRREEE